MTLKPTRASPAVPAPTRIAALVRSHPAGEELTREPVTDRDLSEALSEIWLYEFLRKGRPWVALEDLNFRLIPKFRAADSIRCVGFTLEAVDSQGFAARREFTIHCLDFVAQRAGQRLVTQGTLRNGDSYTYEILSEADTDPHAPWVPAEARRNTSFTTTRIPSALHPLTRSLPELLASADRVGETPDGCLPVLYAPDALRDAERHSRRGACAQPSVETGGVLLGMLGACPDTGEFYVIVTDVMELQKAEGTPYSLAYSSETWKEIRGFLAARQAESPFSDCLRIVGQAHGHNFICVSEDKAAGKTVRLSSTFLSSQDRVWSRAVFARQPWALGHVFGYEADDQPSSALFSLRGGLWMEQGFHVLSRPLEGTSGPRSTPLG